MNFLTTAFEQNDTTNLIKQLSDNLHVFYGIIGAIIFVNLIFMIFLYLKMKQDIKITLKQMATIEKNTEHFFNALSELMTQIKETNNNRWIK